MIIMYLHAWCIHTFHNLIVNVTLTLFIITMLYNDIVSYEDETLQSIILCSEIDIYVHPLKILVVYC